MGKQYVVYFTRGPIASAIACNIGKHKIRSDRMQLQPAPEQCTSGGLVELDVVAGATSLLEQSAESSSRRS
jgi:hypothetical protein